MRKFIGHIIAWFLAPIEEGRADRIRQFREAYDRALIGDDDPWSSIDPASPLLVGNPGRGLSGL